MARRYVLVVLAVLTAMLALVACGGGSTPTPAPEAKVFSVTAKEFAFEPNAFTAKIGDDVVFTIVNRGTLEHSFVVFDPSGAQLARVSVAVHATGTVKLKPAAAGVYTLDCDFPGHKTAGMTGTLTVSP